MIRPRTVSASSPTTKTINTKQTTTTYKAKSPNKKPNLPKDDIVEKEASLTRLSACLETLSAEQKRIVELFYLENKCYKDIEVITGIEWNKVRSHIQNGRRNLKICMDKQQAQEKALTLQINSSKK